MDLRPYIKSQDQLDRGIELIRKNLILYQPYILHDDVEVGQGQLEIDHYKDSKSVFDLNVYAKGFDVGSRRQPADKDYFRQCNAEYSKIYDFIAQTIYDLNGQDLTRLSIAEIGCNSGLNLFNLAMKGAGQCKGYDWNDMTPAFDWLNEVLGVKVEFKQGIWDNLFHKFSTSEIPEVDVMINTIFTNHQCDPLQFLAYICDRSRKAVFLLMLINKYDTMTIKYGDGGGMFDFQSPFPLNYNNAVSVSRSLLEDSLKRLGFGEIVELSPPVGRGLSSFVQSFRMFYAKRTDDTRSAYWHRALGEAESKSWSFDRDNLLKPDMSGGAAIGSGGNAGYPHYAFDQDQTNYWVSPERGSGVKGNAWVGYAFKRPESVARLRLIQPRNLENRQDLVMVQASQDGGATWYNALPKPEKIRAGRESVIIDVPESSPATHWRVVAMADNAVELGHAWAVLGIEFLVRGGVAARP